MARVAFEIYPYSTGKTELRISNGCTFTERAMAMRQIDDWVYNFPEVSFSPLGWVVPDNLIL